MLKRVEIKGFRSCRHVVLDDLGPLTVLVGRNAAGKSNILQAIFWLTSNATSSTPSLFSPHVVERAFAVRSVVGEDTYDYSFEMLVHLDPGSSAAEPYITEILFHQEGDRTGKELFTRRRGDVTLADGTRARIGSSVPSMPALVSVLPRGSDAVRLLRPLLQDLEAVQYYPLESDVGFVDAGAVGATIVTQLAYDHWLTQRHFTHAPSSGAPMRLLDMNLTRTDEFAEAQQLLGPNGLGLVNIQVEKVPVDAKLPEGQKTFYYLGFTPISGSPPNPHVALGFHDLSSGTRRVVGIITSLIYDHSAVMLLEHPEESMHEGLLWKLIDILQGYSDQSQVIIASHSAAVFNAVPPEAIRLVTMEEGETKVRPLSRQELGAAATYLKEEGTLADFLEMVAED
jgi:energy-coupling factor transporter ATP-binding protein EcfA2